MAERWWSFRVSHIWRAILKGAKALRKLGLYLGASGLHSNDTNFSVKNCYQTIHGRPHNDIIGDSWKQIWMIRDPLRFNLYG